MAAASVLSDADLHGLVDGHLDPDRRADVLRRAAASPRDRALVELWQDQADMIRAAFAGVENEPLPSRLDLRMPPKLHAVPRFSAVQTEAVAAAKAAPKARARSSSQSRRRLATAATIAAVAVGLAGSWYVASLPADLPTEGVRAPAALWSGAERQLVDRTVAALAFGESGTPLLATSAEPPTTTTIPDLSGAGFTFTGAEARGVAPRSLVFRYRNASDERIAIGAVRSEGDDSAPMPRGSGFAWRSGRVTFAIFGTVTSERLGAIAASLHAETTRD